MNCHAAQEAIQLREVSGAIVNGTANSLPAFGLTVTLHRQTASTYEESTTTTDTKGNFRFENIPLDPEALYGVTVRYQGVVYGTDIDLRPESIPPVTDQYLRDVGRPVAPLGFQLLTAHTAGRQDRPRRLRPGDRKRGERERPDLRPRSRADESPPLRPARRARRASRSTPPSSGPTPFRSIADSPSPPTSLPASTRSCSPTTSATKASPSRLISPTCTGPENARILVPYEIGDLSSVDFGSPGDVKIGDKHYQLIEVSDIARESRAKLEISSLPQATLWDKTQATASDIPYELARPGGARPPDGLPHRDCRSPPRRDIRVVRLPYQALSLKERAMTARSTIIAEQIADLERALEEGKIREASYHAKRQALLDRLATLPLSPSTD